jgi:hypothetical protein
MADDERPESRSAKPRDEMRAKTTLLAGQDERMRDLIRQSQELVRRSRALSKQVEATIGTTKHMMGED